ncbi:hypothetical protein [Niabella sp.]
MVYKDAFEYELRKTILGMIGKKHIEYRTKTLFYHISFMPTLSFSKGQS